MLDIVPGYCSMQFTGKLMNQTWEIDRISNFGPHFHLFDPHLGSKIFFVDFASTNIVTTYHCIQFQRKVKIQTQENGKKT